MRESSKLSKERKAPKQKVQPPPEKKKSNYEMLLEKKMAKKQVQSPKK